MEFARAQLGENQEQIAEFDKHASVESLDALHLDEDNKIGYTFKCMGSGLYVFRTGTNFKEAINELVLHAGDADTNGAVAGALLGCKVGYSQLPLVWLDGLKEKQWLEIKVKRLLELLGLN